MIPKGGKGGLPAGDIGPGGLRLNGYKVTSVTLRENELVFRLRGIGSNGGPELVLRGIIGFEDQGVTGRALGVAEVADRGSYRSLVLHRKDGKALARCEFLEARLAAG